MHIMYIEIISYGLMQYELCSVVGNVLNVNMKAVFAKFSKRDKILLCTEFDFILLVSIVHKLHVTVCSIVIWNVFYRFIIIFFVQQAVVLHDMVAHESTVTVWRNGTGKRLQSHSLSFMLDSASQKNRQKVARYGFLVKIRF